MNAYRSASRNRSPAGTPPARSVRSRIIAEARRHFLAHGFRIVTMDDLAADLGVSKKTLYEHFSGKVALLEAVLRDKLHDVDADLGRITAAGFSDFPAALQALYVCLQRHMEEIQPAFLRDVQREQPDMFRLVQTRRREMVRRYFGKVLDEGRKAGLVSGDIPANLIIEILSATVQAIMNPQKMEEFGLTPRTGFLTVIGVVLRGVMTDKGRASINLPKTAYTART
jgi:AcrR family transcriptional regulator